MADEAHALGIVTGRREMAERAAAELRRRIALWRGQDAPRVGLAARLRAALLWSITETWCGRVEMLAAALESEAQTLRVDEAKRRETLAQPRRRWPWR